MRNCLWQAKNDKGGCGRFGLDFCQHPPLVHFWLVINTYLIGTNCKRSNIEILRMILAIMGKDSDDFSWVSDCPGHEKRYSLDTSKLCRELGWQSELSDFEVGLRETIECIARIASGGVL